MIAVKRMLRYIKGKMEHEILFSNNDESNEVSVLSCTNSELCGDKEDRNSTTCYISMIGRVSISRCSEKELAVAIPSCEAKCIEASLDSCQNLWLNTLLKI